MQLTDAIEKQNETQRVFSKKIEGIRYDVGNSMGYLNMSLVYGLKYPKPDEGLTSNLIDLAHKLR